MDMNLNFGGKSAAPQKKGQPPQATIDDAMGMIRDVMRRLRQLEERHTNLRKTVQMHEQNLLKQNKKTNADIKDVDQDIVELKNNIRSMGEEIKLIIREVKDTVKKDDVKVLEKYIGFWKPMSYVTHSELEKEVKKVLDRELDTITEKAKVLKDKQANDIQ